MSRMSSPSARSYRHPPPPVESTVYPTRRGQLVPLTSTVRGFLLAALANLSVVGGVLVSARFGAAYLVPWNDVIWLLLVGFVSCSTLGFSLHLFPALARRPLPKRPGDAAALGLVESSVVLGSLALSSPPYGAGFRPAFVVAAVLFSTAIALVVGRFARALTHVPREMPGTAARPGDAATLPLFMVAWSAALASGLLFALSGIDRGPGFGWWLAAVHSLVLGHAATLIAAVSLRLVPRSVSTDPPRWATGVLAGLGGAGAVLVPAGMLVATPSSPVFLAWSALPEAGFAVAFFGLFISLGVRARTPRRPFALQLVGIVSFLGGGGLGLWMVSRGEYAPVSAHAFIGVLGFVGLTILVMWFSMIAPFQRISHAWTARMLWVLSIVWIVGAIALALTGDPGFAFGPRLPTLGGALILAAALAWAAGTVPVLFPGLNPLPGLTPQRIRTIRNWWEGR